MTLEEKAKEYAHNNYEILIDTDDAFVTSEDYLEQGYIIGAKENGFILHDLEKDSNDLPKENKQYLCKLKWFVGGGISYECLYWNNDFDYWTDKCGESICDKVICWYEIPQGE